MSSAQPRHPEPQDARTAWDDGDYARIAERLLPVARDLVEAADVATGQRVVDVAAGTGNAALAAAIAGATVTAVDLAPTLVAAGRARTADLPVTWHVADASALPLPDANADVVVSSFGMIFVADRAALVAEVARVLRPGGRLAFTAWQPGRETERLHEVLRRHLPPDIGGPEATDWARPDIVKRLLKPAFHEPRTTTERFVWTFDSVGETLAFFLDASPLHVAALAAADDAAAVRAEFADELQRMAGASGAVRIDSPYARTIAVRA